MDGPELERSIHADLLRYLYGLRNMLVEESRDRGLTLAQSRLAQATVLYINALEAEEGEARRLGGDVRRSRNAHRSITFSSRSEVEAMADGWRAGAAKVKAENDALEASHRAANLAYAASRTPTPNKDGGT